MNKSEIIEGFINADRPYEVCAHTTMGGYMEFVTVERLLCEENAKWVCDEYSKSFKKSANIKAVCVRYKRRTIYEVEL